MPLPNIDSKVPAFRAVHRSMAGILIIFVAAHVANHLAALVSVSSHVELMVRLRTLYRTPIIEAALLGCIGVHIVSGLVLLGRGRKMRSEQ